MINSPFGARATAAAVFALLASMTALDAPASFAATTSQKQNRTRKSAPTRPRQVAQTAVAPTEPATTNDAVHPTQTFQATAYSLPGRTASGQMVRRGIIAADRRVLPLGTRVRLSAGGRSGEYTVADTGGAVRGRIIDIWVPSTSEAMKFGRRNVQLTVLQYPRGTKSAPAARTRKAKK